MTESIKPKTHQHQSVTKDVMNMSEPHHLFYLERCSKEVKLLFTKGDKGGRPLPNDPQWEYFPNKYNITMSMMERFENNIDIVANIDDFIEEEHTYYDEFRSEDECAYQMVNVHGLKQWIASNCRN